MDYAEFGRMSVIREPGVSRAPEWTASDDKIKRVVAFHLRASLRDNTSNVPDDLTSCRNLDRLILARGLQNPSNNYAKHVARLKLAGGPLAFWTTFIYRRWRLRMTYYDLEAKYGIPAATLRTYSYRLNRIARYLFSDNFKPRKQGTINVDRVLELRKQGLSRRAIGRALGWDRGVILRVLRRHDVN
jgi:hypothetical protein